MTQAASAWALVAISILCLSSIVVSGTGDADCTSDNVFCLTMTMTGSRTGDREELPGDVFFIGFERLPTHTLVRAGRVGDWDRKTQWTAKIKLLCQTGKCNKDAVILSLNRTADKDNLSLNQFSLDAKQANSEKEFSISVSFNASLDKNAGLIVDMPAKIAHVTGNELILEVEVNIDNVLHTYKSPAPLLIFKHDPKPGNGEHTSNDKTGIILWVVAVVLVVLLALIILAAVFGIRREYKTIATLRSSRSSTASAP